MRQLRPRPRPRGAVIARRYRQESKNYKASSSGGEKVSISFLAHSLLRLGREWFYGVARNPEDEDEDENEDERSFGN